MLNNKHWNKVNNFNVTFVLIGWTLNNVYYYLVKIKANNKNGALSLKIILET